MRHTIPRSSWYSFFFSFTYFYRGKAYLRVAGRDGTFVCVY